MKKYFLITASIFLILACRNPKKNAHDDTFISPTDSIQKPRHERYYWLDSTINVVVQATPAPPSKDFKRLMSIIQRLNYSLLKPIGRQDTLDFRCWTWIDTINHGTLTERLVYRNLTTYYAVFDEVTRKRSKKYMLIFESIFPSEEEAANAAVQIKNFIFRDPETRAYDKSPTDIFRVKSRIYTLHVGDFMSIPDMKRASEKFRELPGLSVDTIMLWDKYGAEEDN